jgi:hypothetical protein
MYGIPNMKLDKEEVVLRRLQMLEQEAGVDGGHSWPVLVPPFMKELIEQITICARASKHIDQQSGVSARFSIANYRTMVASARHRAVRLGEKPAVPRISDLGHLYASSLGKIELDLMGSHQLSERQVLDGIIADAIATVFNATEPDQLRGPQFDAALCDELAKWRYARETWDQLQFGLRLGIIPRPRERNGPVNQRFGVIGVKVNGFLVVGDGFISTAKLHQGGTVQHGDAAPLGVEFGGLLKLGHGLKQAALLSEDDTPVNQRFFSFRGELSGFF